MSTLRTLSHTTAVPNSDFVIFGVAHYEPEHSEQLQRLASSFGAGFAGNCFCVHREVMALHDDYAAELLTEASNHGLLP